MTDYIPFVDSLFQLTTEQRDATYRELRERAQAEYALVDRRAYRNAQFRCDKLRGVGRESQAERIEQGIEASQTSYDELVLRKWLAAIALGRYDFALREGRPAGASGRPGAQPALDRAAELRRQELE